MKNYVLEGVKGFSDTQFYKSLKTKYKLFQVFNRENRKFPEDLRETVRQVWDEVQELTFLDCLSETNTEKRRVLFSAYGPENILKDGDAVIEDTQTITKTNKKFVNGKEEEYTFKDTYTLYSIKNKQILESLSNKELKIVKCSCTTTGKDHYLFVDPKSNDAIEAIASTIRVPIIGYNHKYITEIYRQGDVIGVRIPKDSDIIIAWNVPISKEIYLTKLKVES